VAGHPAEAGVELRSDKVRKAGSDPGLFLGFIAIIRYVVIVRLNRTIQYAAAFRLYR